MSVDPLDISKLTEGKVWCHRTQPMLIPRELQRMELIRLACLREACTLWDPTLSQCRDVSNANWLVEIAKSLEKLVNQADVLSFHAGER